ncbi:MAG: hypothetical protein V1907_03350 [Candidatus Kerfeldbacteria bacterium]
MDVILVVACFTVPVLLVWKLGGRTMFMASLAFGPVLWVIVHSVRRRFGTRVSGFGTEHGGVKPGR